MNLITRIFKLTLKDLFTQKHDRSFPSIVRDFYLKLRLVGTSLELFVRGMEIGLHKDPFGWIFELPTLGTSFTFDRPLGLRKLKHFTTINTLIINPMEKNKVPFKSSQLKPKVRIFHYLLTKILFPRNINHSHVQREYVIPLWLLSQEIPTNCVYLIFNNMIRCKYITSVGIPHEPIISRLLAAFNIDTMDGKEDSTNRRITYTDLRKIKVMIKYGEIQ